MPRFEDLATEGQALVEVGGAVVGAGVVTTGSRAIAPTGVPFVEIGNTGSESTLHLTTGVGFSGPYLLGLGVDHDDASGLVASVKANNDIGIGVTLENASGVGSVGMLGQHFGPGSLVKLVNGDGTGPLLELRNDFGGLGNLLTWGIGVGEVNGYIGPAGDFVVQYGTDDKNATRIAPSGGGNLVLFSQWTGAPDLWFSSAIATGGQSLYLQSGTGATGLGSETLATLVELKNGNSLGFFGATPVTKPTGVAVTAAGVHAALVSLGLIAA